MHEEGLEPPRHTCTLVGYAGEKTHLLKTVGQVHEIHSLSSSGVIRLFTDYVIDFIR